eukprot:scaffold63304_cov20-Prasinocladus_malaysianus.AAC.2
MSDVTVRTVPLTAKPRTAGVIHSAWLAHDRPVGRENLIPQSRADPQSMYSYSYRPITPLTFRALYVASEIARTM